MKSPQTHDIKSPGQVARDSNCLNAPFSPPLKKLLLSLMFMLGATLVAGCNDDTSGSAATSALDTIEDSGTDSVDSADNNSVGQDVSPDLTITEDTGLSSCAPLNECGDECADLEGDSLNCGACGSACEDGQACVAGDCVEVG